MSESDTSGNAPAEAKDQPLDDIMLAMDVVDTLRHRERILARELDAAGREAELIDRLREIYAAQGIEVPDDVLRDGVRALEEQRFTYTPPEGGVQTFLARIYVSRDRWWKPVAAGFAALVAVAAVWEFGVSRPREARAAAERVELQETLPTQANRLFARIEGIAEEDAAMALARTHLTDALTASADGDAERARAAVSALETLEGDLERSYEVRVVYGPDEPFSGIYRINDDSPLGARNYYLIVEAIDPAGRPVAVTVESQEDRRTDRVSRWGQAVPKAVFDRVADDKRDDQIIQDAVIGTKPTGRLTPEWRVAVEPGRILEW